MDLGQFWKRYAERHPQTPKADRFRGEHWNRAWGAGWAAHYDYEGDGFTTTVTQYLSKTRVVTYLYSWEKGEQWEARLTMYQRAFKEAFDAEESDSDGRLCAVRLVLPGGVSNRANWNLMIDWMEHHRLEYERILCSHV